MLVPLCIDRGIDMLIGLLGIMKTGAAFVPIDPDYPEDRIKFMLDDTAATIVLTNAQSRSKISVNEKVKVIELDTDQFKIEAQPISNPEVSIQPQNLAYLIYTSGSTGKPKGVMIEHKSLINLLQSISNEVQFTSTCSFFAVTTYSFDISYLELFLPIINGGKLIIASKEVTNDGYKLEEKISLHLPTHMQGTPSTWQLLIDAGWENKEAIKILVGGEAVKESLKNHLTQWGEVFNVYGPTETTIWSAIKKLSANEKVVIGKPLANTSIYILDEFRQLSPIGIIGEIIIGGSGLARGYLNRDELTAEKFIQNPFSDDPRSRLYKTGDVGRWLANGDIEYLGRIDDQVKIRGYRIELGEIESVLLQSGLVEQAVVLAKDDAEGNKRLVGYVVTENDFDKETNTCVFA